MVKKTCHLRNLSENKLLFNLLVLDESLTKIKNFFFYLKSTVYTIVTFHTTFEKPAKDFYSTNRFQLLNRLSI